MLSEDDFRDMMPDSREVYESFNMKEKQSEPVMAKFIKVLEDSPKGVSQAELNKVAAEGFHVNGEILNQTFKIPQGPARIGSQWW